MHNSFIDAGVKQGVAAPDETPVDEQELQAIIEEARTRARRRRIRLAATVVAALGLVAAFWFIAGTGGGSKAASGAGSSNSAVGGVQYSRMKVEGLVTTGRPGAPYSLRLPIVIDVWVRPDGSGRVRRTHLPAQWPGPRDKRRAKQQSDKRSLAQAEGRRLPEDSDAELSAGQLAEEVSLPPGLPPSDSLSTDPEELRQQLINSDAVQHANLPANEVLFRAAGGLVMSPNIDDDVRAAGYRVISAIPGVEVDPAARDPLGRRATALTLTEQRRGGSASTLFFAPSTGQALAEVERLQHREKFLDSRRMGSAVVTQTRTVDKVPPVPGN